MRKNKGISLIVLVVTIIIIIILAGAVILNLTDNNVISKAREAAFKNNVSQYSSELELSISKEYLEDFSFNRTKMNAGIWNGNNDNIIGTIKEYISSITVNDGKKFEIVNGQLVYVGTDNAEEYEYAKDLDLINIVESTSDSWIFDAATGTVSGYIGEDWNTLKTITVPDYIDGVAVKSVKGSVNYSEGPESFLKIRGNPIVVSEIILPKGLTSIGGSAFRGCDKLTNIIIPSGVTSVGYAAFAECSSLTNITLPSNVASIDDFAFYECANLTNIEVAETNNYFTSIDGVLFNDDISTILYYPVAKNDTSYTIPSSVTNIAYCGLRGTKKLTNVIMQNGLTNIGVFAFADSDSLVSVTIPNTVTNIDDAAFSDCYNLTSITIPSSVTTMTGSIFSRMYKIN